ncbi:glycerate kinase family protein [Enterococcus sp. AZ072]|uniref:glycerate kinase family protein n=1 Tax=unclassified Enterococcus TaxID=2608891 RepID=UPI003D27FAB6
MKVLIMPDSFKGSLSAPEVAAAVQKGLARVWSEAEYLTLPVGDGGEGTLDALISSLNLMIAEVEVTGPFGDEIAMRYGFKGQQAFFEMADLVGLPQIPAEQRFPLRLQTNGLGELLVYLVQQNFTEIGIGVGGSANVDGGIGFAAGLGYRFLDEEGKELLPIGENLAKVAKIDDEGVFSELNQATVKIINDVKNPLCGEQGAAAVFGPQKGLREEEIKVTDEALQSFYQLAAPEVLALSGAGAGGGIAAGVVAFAQGQIVSGIDYVLDLMDFEETVKDADLVIVGEGRMDQQSLSGKAPVGIAQRVPKEIPVIALCGSVDKGLTNTAAAGITAAFPILHQPEELPAALADTEANLIRTAESVASFYQKLVEKY